MAFETKKFSFVRSNEFNLLPQTTGVYAFKSKKAILYIGKAVNIKERVKNHFSFTPTPKLGVGASPSFKDNIFAPQTTHIGYIATGSEIEALLLEAELIKKHKPKYNTMWRDDKSHCYIAISQEEFPRILIVHQKDIAANFQFSKKIQQIGPFIDSRALKQTLRVLRRVLPYRTCNKMPKKPCLYKALNLCLAPCQNNTKKEYRQNIKNLIKVLQGKKPQVLKNLRKEMKLSSQEQDFEKAKILRDQIFALENVFSHSHILEQAAAEGTECLQPKALGSFGSFQKILGLKEKIKRIEGYDISNIQGKQATGSMAVFENGKPSKEQYRKFKIKIEGKPNDTAMLQEIISRRLKHKEWPLPQIMLIDGGKAQLNAACEAINRDPHSVNRVRVSVVSLAKKKNELFIENRQRPIFLKNTAQDVANLILHIRDEAHRFAIAYHKKLRSKNFLQ